MNRMKGSVNTKKGRKFLRLVSHSVKTQELMRRTPEAKEAILARNDLAEGIQEAIEDAGAIEDLIHYEMTLQQLDRLSAQSQEDENSIGNAERDYRQLAETVEQMRRNPEEYFRANIALRGTGGDFRKLPRSRIDHIHANITRMRNRATFVPDEEREIWEARIQLASKTIEMLRAMHKRLVQEYEDKTEPK